MSSNALQYWNDAASSRFNALDTLTASYSSFDEEIDALQTVLSSVRMRRNRLSFVSRLPPELLARIFSVLADIEVPGMPYKDLGWIKVSHVCSHWRQVALGDSRLWTSVVLNNGEKWTQEMILRAKKTPLIIAEHSIDSEETMSAVRHVVSTHRLQLMDIQLDGTDEMIMSVMQALTSPMPVLERVKLENTSPGDEEELLHLPPDLFGLDAPRLHSAFFRGFVFPWSSSLWRNLSNLSISLPKGTQPPSLSEDEFFDGLANMQHLESLRIDEYFPSSPQPASSTHMKRPAVNFSRLSHLVLEGPWSIGIVVLGSIHIPETAQVRLNFSEFSYDGFHNVLIPFLERHGGKSGHAPPLHTLLIDRRSMYKRLYICGWTSLDAPDPRQIDRFYPPAHDPSLCLRFSHSSQQPIHELEFPETMETIVQTLHIQELSALSFELEVESPRTYIATFQLLESARRLEYASFIKGASILACIVLSSKAVIPESRGGKTNDHKPDILFPKLRYLSLYSRALLTPLPLVADELTYYQSLLIQSFIQRENMQAHVRKFDLNICTDHDTLTKRWADQLESVMPVTVTRRRWGSTKQ